MNKIEFTLEEKKNDRGRPVISVVPTFKQISREKGLKSLENMICGIAANCIRILASKHGLERAIEMTTDATTNHTTIKIESLNAEEE